MEYISPCEAFGDKISGSLNDKIVPVIIDEAGEKKIDFRFLKGDLITEASKLKSVSDIKDNLRANVSNVLPTVDLLVGSSGAGKTKAEFDIGREQFVIYHDCPGLNLTYFPTY